VRTTRNRWTLWAECIFVSLQPFVGPWPLFSFLIFYTVGRNFGRGIGPSQGRYLHTEQPKHRKTHTDIHASSAIRTHDPSVCAGEDNSCLRPRGHWSALVHIVKFYLFCQEEKKSEFFNFWFNLLSVTFETPESWKNCISVRVSCIRVHFRSLILLVDLYLMKFNSMENFGSFWQNRDETPWKGN
jgi:hypothetical protein